jgi:hypothetical protein
MSVVCSGSVVSSIDGLTLTFTDTGTGYGTILGRTLTVNDADGNPLYPPFDMGLSIIQEVPVTQDQYLSFILVVVDDTGLYECTLNYFAEGIYLAAFLQAMVALGCCGSQNNFFTMFKAELLRAAGERYSLSANGVAANTCIAFANKLVNSITGG